MELRCSYLSIVSLPRLLSATYVSRHQLSPAIERRSFRYIHSSLGARYCQLYGLVLASLKLYACWPLEMRECRLA